MKRNSRFIIFMASAIITFGSLVAFVGTDHLEHHRHGCHYQNTDSTISQSETQTINFE